MGERGIGLFNRDMIRMVKELWHDGGVGLIYASLSLPNPAADMVLQQWEGEEVSLFWRGRLDHEYIFLIRRLPQRMSIEGVINDAVIRLSSRLKAAYAKECADDSECPFHVGTALAYPSVAGRSTESVFYHALLEAMGNNDSRRTVVKESMTNNNKLVNRQWMSACNWSGSYVPIGKLAEPFPVFHANTRVAHIATHFDMNPRDQGAIIVNEERPVGLLMKEKLYALLAGQFGLPLYWNRSVDRIMNDHPLIVDEATPVEDVSQLAMARAVSQLYDVVIITKEGRMIGGVSMRSILECITAMRTEEARSANPLTGLPGNEGIQAELERRIERKRPFAILYADLDYFKWFNDCFGFTLGDALIRYLANLLCSVRNDDSDNELFVGHIGGDDFITMLEPTVGEKVCKKLIEQFDEGVHSFYGEAEMGKVEDRQGRIIEQDGVTLSLSLMIWDGNSPLTTGDIAKAAAKLKKQAKAVKGSAYVMTKLTGVHQEEGR